MIPNNEWPLSGFRIAKLSVQHWAKADDRARGGDTLRRDGSEGAEKREFLIVLLSKYPLGTRAALRLGGPRGANNQ
jgi:hypothetical protein